MIAWLFRMVFGGFCAHGWRTLVERELPSKLETMKGVGLVNIPYEWTRHGPEIASKTFVAVVSCDKCGAVKVVEVRT